MAKKQWTFDEVEALYRQFNPNAIDGAGQTVLVAEDQPPMRKLIANALRKKGFEVLEAENGLQALKHIRASLPDLCLLDINMPQVSGLDILEAMQKDDRFANIPVVIVTARKEKRDIMLAQKYGAAGYVIKPFVVEDLMQKVRDILQAG